MSDVSMGSYTLAYMVCVVCVLMVCVCAWCVYVYPTMVRVYMWCACTLYAMLYRSTMVERNRVYPTPTHVPTHVVDTVHGAYTHDVASAADMVYAQYMRTMED